MKSKGRIVYLLLIMLLALSVEALTFKPTYAQSISKPAVPEFTIQYMNHSYVTQRLEIIDPKTGYPSSIIPSINFDQPTILFTIKNQALNATGGTPYYNFRYKIAGQDSWNYYPFEGNKTTHPYGLFTSGHTNPAILVIDSSVAGKEFTFIPINFTVPDGSKAEVQAQALHGSIDPIPDSYPKTIYGETDFYWQFSGQASDWSNTHTISIPDGTVTISTSISPTPTVPELTWLITLPLLLSVFSVALVLRHRKIPKA